TAKKIEEINNFKQDPDETLYQAWERFKELLMKCTQHYLTEMQEVLKNKKDERGIVIRNKARLVAQGHTQEEGIDYDEVFAPVAIIEAIRLFLAYASLMGFTVYQMDVKSAFLYGAIDEEVYVMQPPGFHDPEFPTRVYKLEKAMFGLHQASRVWYGTLSKYLLTNGFQRGTIDQTLFIRRHRGDFILVQVYMDEIIFGSSNPQLCREFEALMHEKFQMSAMGRRLISWKCKKQTIVATSTTEAEYGTAASCCGQVLWIQNQLLDYGLSKFEADFKQQQSEMTNKIDTFLKAINDRMKRALPSDTVKNPKLYVNPTSSALSDGGSPKFLYSFQIDQCHQNSLELGKSGSAFIQGKMPKKMNDPGLLIIPCRLRDSKRFNTLADLGSCVNLIPLYLFKNLKIGLLEETEDVLGLRMELSPTASAVIDCKNAKRAVGEGVTRIETMKEGTKILATVDGKLRTISKSSIRRNLKLNDEAGISSFLDAELFENLQLMGYNILPNQKFTFQKGQFSHQ
nr:putative ribonuclease H-like domain-containing protein [Tanacetum cinerariifolium]